MKIKKYQIKIKLQDGKIISSINFQNKTEYEKIHKIIDKENYFLIFEESLKEIYQWLNFSSEKFLISHFKLYFSTSNILIKKYNIIYKSNRKIYIDKKFIEKYIYGIEKKIENHLEIDRIINSIKINSYSISKIENYLNQSYDEIKINFTSFYLPIYFYQQIKEKIENLFPLNKFILFSDDRKYFEKIFNSILKIEDFILLKPEKNTLKIFFYKNEENIENIQINLDLDNLLEEIKKELNLSNQDESRTYLKTFLNGELIDFKKKEKIKFILDNYKNRFHPYFETLNQNLLIPEYIFIPEGNNFKNYFLKKLNIFRNITKLKIK